MKALVTGCAGFIGSILAEELCKRKYKVIGIDSFENYYSRKIKENNLKNLIKNENFKFIEGNVLDINLRPIIEKVDYVFHLAAQPGVRASWGEFFEVYTRNNVLATQRLLEVCKNSSIKKFVYASSSSVYGDSEELPLKEETIPKPISPYGVTKLAAEHLCNLYYKNFKVPVVSLRYFTVYGERQRPDMAFHKFIKAILEGKEIYIFGDGTQTRDFTYVGDIVEGTILAAESEVVGEVFNLGGGSRIMLKDAIKTIENIINKEAKIVYREYQKGDMKHTYADITKARKYIGYNPKVKLRYGLEKEVEWIKEIYKVK